LSLEGQFTEVGGYRTYYVRYGRGPAVVLLHGQSPGSCVELIWGATIEPLADAGFTVYAFDQVGFGRSDHPADYSIGPRIAHTRAFLDAMGLDQAAFWTASDGGYIASTIGLDDPRVSHLIIMANATLSPGAPSDSEDSRRERAEARAQYTPSIEEARKRLTRSIGDSSAVTDDLARVMYEATSGKNFEALQARQRAPRPPAIYDELHRLTIPVLLLWGLDDNHGGERSVMLLEKIPGAELHLFDHSSQWPQRDHPQRSLATVREFLRGGRP
jgi:pimeloyl-ACP methyl ester carboxylesterase